MADTESAATPSQPAIVGAGGAGRISTANTDSNTKQDGDAGAKSPTTNPQGETSLSLDDSGLSNRPRDARLLHMVLASYGVSAYQERVPLMLMDFAYRYTSSTLSDALHFSAEGYGYSGKDTSSGGGGGRGGGGAGGAASSLSEVTLPALRLSINSRTHYQFDPTLPTNIYAELAQEKNLVALPPLKKEWGSALPPEQYCLLGNGFQMEEEEGGEDDDEDDEGEGVDGIRGGAGGDDDDDTTMKDGENADDEDVGGDEPEGGKMEDLFGGGVNGDGDEMES